MLFDPDHPQGNELFAAYGLADRLAELDVFQDLCEADSTFKARKHITVGQFDTPVDGVQFDISELAELGFQARINRIDGERVATVDGYGQTSSAGVLQLLLRRFVREGEDSQDVYLFFWDRLDKLQDDLANVLSTATCPRLQQGAVVSVNGPYRGLQAEEVAQGGYLHAVLTVPWGDAIGD